MVGMTPEELQKIIDGIDVLSAKCYDPDGSGRDRSMILGKVMEQSGSYEAFNTHLKLQLMLNPISHKADLQQLIDRSKGTTWRLDQVSSWMNVTSVNSPRALVIMAGAGEGKSSISAAICDQLLGMNEKDDRQQKSESAFYAAAHFLKFSDARRLDTVKIVKFFAFQLARQIPTFSDALLQLSAIDVERLTDFEEAFDLLLSKLPKVVDKPVFILIDAVDEADPIELQLGGSDKLVTQPGSDKVQSYVKPCGNRTVYMLSSCLAPRLPKNFKFILTTRPDAMSHGIRDTLTRTFGANGVKFIEDPSCLRVSSSSASSAEKGKVMVFDYIYKKCDLGKLGVIKPACPSLGHTYAAYKAIFDARKPSPEARRLLGVLVAAREPLSVSLLESMSLAHLLSELPGSSTLIYVQEHKVFFVHKSFIDWLRDDTRSGDHAVNELQGHASLALCLLKDVVSAADAKEEDGSAAVVASEYSLKYALHHLCLAVAGGRLDLSLLNVVLGNWPFLRQVFRSGELFTLPFGSIMHRLDDMIHLQATVGSWWRLWAPTTSRPCLMRKSHPLQPSSMPRTPSIASDAISTTGRRILTTWKGWPCPPRSKPSR